MVEVNRDRPAFRTIDQRGNGPLEYVLRRLRLSENTQLHEGASLILFLAFLFPVAIYFLILGAINRRDRPLMVSGAWDSIPLVDDDGKLIPYRATLETKLGSIEITLRPDLAPNHVRNFIALARAGYYDGLLFEQIVRQQDPDQPEIHLDIIEAGCPTGTGEAGFDSLGSIGYWLKDEFKPEAEHEEGTVGACHGIEADTAACRFYITLCKAPQLNGNFTVFGKVTKGLDVVRTISLQPVRIEEQDTDGYHKPDKPVVIDKVTIQVGK